MRVLQLVENEDNRIRFAELPIPEPRADEVLIKMRACSLNRRDYWITEGKYPKIKYGVTLGSDGCGQVIDRGSEVSQKILHQEVVINPNIEWGDDPAVQSSKYRILGMPENGTFAEYITVPAHRVFQKPQHLTSSEAAAVPLAGLTAYRAVFTHGNIQPQNSVLISGVGGGVAQFAYLFAQKSGAHVFVTSGSNHKIEYMLQHGVQGAVNYNTNGWDKILKEQSTGFDLLIDSAAGEGFNQFIRMMKPAGRIVFYGATRGLPKNLDLYTMFFRQISIQGSTMGSDIEFARMLKFIEQHQITPIIDSVRPFSQIASAIEKMRSNQQFGKLVMTFDES